MRDTQLTGAMVVRTRGGAAEFAVNGDLRAASEERDKSDEGRSRAGGP